MKARFITPVVIFIALAAGYHLGSKQTQEQQQIDASKIVLSIQNIVKLAVIESSLHQVYDFSKDNLKLSELSIPFTKQKTLIGVDGTAMFGFNVEQATANIFKEQKSIAIALPAPTLLSLDLDYKFLSEESTFLNRLTPEDRNEILETIRRRVIKELQGSDLPQRVETRMRALLNELGSVTNMAVEVTVKNEAGD